MTSVFHQKQHVASSSLEISLSKKIGVKAAYHDLPIPRPHQKWDFCAHVLPFI